MIKNSRTLKKIDLDRKTNRENIKQKLFLTQFL
jgi:hypothetical protein